MGEMVDRELRVMNGYFILNLTISSNGIQSGFAIGDV